MKDLKMSECEGLLIFATRVSTLVALMEFHFGGCKSLEKITEGLGGLTCLKKLYMKNCEALDEF